MSKPKPQIHASHFLLDLMRAELEHAGPMIARIGRQMAGKVRRLEWSPEPEERRFRVSVADFSSGLYFDEQRVVIDLPWGPGDALGVDCNCRNRLGFEDEFDFGFEDEFDDDDLDLEPELATSGPLCSHAYAAIERVIDFFEKNPNDPITLEALRLEGTWRRSLAVVERILDGQRGPAKAQGESRLTWRVGPGRERLEVGIWEQKLSRRTGRWSPGRRMKWDEFLDRPPSSLGNIERDIRRALRDRLDEEDLSRLAYQWPIDALAGRAFPFPTLVGHPLVFRLDETRRAIRVEEAPLVLRVETVAADGEAGESGGAGQGGGGGEKGEELVVEARLGGRPVASFAATHLARDGGTIAALDEAEERLLVGSCDPAGAELVDHFSRPAVPMPPAARAALLPALAELGRLVSVELGDAFAGPPRPAEDKLYLLLDFDDRQALDIALRVRPDGRQSLVPGEGAARLTTVNDDGVALIHERDLTAEVEAAKELCCRLELPGEFVAAAGSWHLDGEPALDLLAGAQEAAAAGEVVVEWTGARRPRVRGQLTPDTLRVEIEDRRDWFGLRGAVQVGDAQVPLVELLAALRGGRRWVPLAGGDWARISDELRQRLGAVGEAVHQHRDRLEVDATGLLAMRDLLADEAVAIEASERFHAFVARLKASERLVPEPPEDLEAELRDYQLAGYRWLRRLSAWGVGGCLADDMGLGKTVQTLAVLLARRNTGPALVVAPTSVGFNWLRETARFAPSLAAFLYRGRDRGELLDDLGAGDVLVTSYGLLQRDVEELATITWGSLVLDEAQAVKNSQTKTSKAARKLEARWRLALTGTPIENHLGELWSLYRVISPGIFGSWESFRERYAEPIERWGDEDRRKALAGRLRPFLLRRTKREVLAELPDRTEVELYAEPSAAERQRYDRERQAILEQLARPSEARDRRFEILAGLTRLRQLACHPALVERDWKKGSAKLELLLEILEELRDGDHRALVFSQFVGHLELVRKVLDERGISYLYLDGRTSAKERERRVDAFQEGEADFFLISLKAGGTGLNLTAANYVVHLDPWWNPAVEDQASDRAHRIGQARAVTIYRLISRGTIEEEILRLHGQKRDLVAGVLDGSDRAARLSTEELVELIRSGGGEE